MGCVESGEFEDWWDSSTDIEKINWLIHESIVAFCDRENRLVGVKLYPIVDFRKKNKWVRAMSEDGESYFKKEYFNPIANFCKPKEWFLTEKRVNKKNGHEYRLLVGRIDEDKYVLLAPIKADPQVTEAFESD